MSCARYQNDRPELRAEAETAEDRTGRNSYLYFWDVGPHRKHGRISGGVMNAVYEVVAAEKVLYKRGCVSQYLTGANASLYKQMIWKYGKAAATERFWWFWHKKEA